MQVCGMAVKNYLPENRLETARVLRFDNMEMLNGSITIEGEQCHFMLNLFVVGIDAVMLHVTRATVRLYLFLPSV